MLKKKALGRGLGALIEDIDQGINQVSAPMELSIEAITANPLQPRKNFKARDLKALTDSIRDKGVLEPLVVRRIAPGSYELIAGERRLRASTEAGLKTVPVILRDATAVEMLELALIENLHREDLNPMEEAEAYQRLADEFDRNQEELARLAGKDRSTVANTLRLLQLPKAVQDDVRHGRLTAGHARALLALSDQERIQAAREQVLAGQLSVRETEALVKRLLQPPQKKKAAGARDDVYFQALAGEFSRRLGSKVNITRKGRRGRIEITFASNDELERIMKALGVGPL